MARRCVLRLLLDELLLIVNLLRVDVLLLCINLPPVSKKLTLIDALLRCTNLLQLDELLELSLTGRCVVFAIWLIVSNLLVGEAMCTFVTIAITILVRMRFY